MPAYLGQSLLAAPKSAALERHGIDPSRTGVEGFDPYLEKMELLRQRAEAAREMIPSLTGRPAETPTPRAESPAMMPASQAGEDEKPGFAGRFKEQSGVPLWAAVIGAMGDAYLQHKHRERMKSYNPWTHTAPPEPGSVLAPMLAGARKGQERREAREWEERKLTSQEERERARLEMQEKLSGDRMLAGMLPAIAGDVFKDQTQDEILLAEQLQEQDWFKALPAEQQSEVLTGLLPGQRQQMGARDRVQEMQDTVAWIQQQEWMSPQQKRLYTDAAMDALRGRGYGATPKTKEQIYEESYWRGRGTRAAEAGALEDQLSKGEQTMGSALYRRYRTQPQLHPTPEDPEPVIPRVLSHEEATAKVTQDIEGYRTFMEQFGGGPGSAKPYIAGPPPMGKPSYTKAEKAELIAGFKEALRLGYDPEQMRLQFRREHGFDPYEGERPVED